jgi:hypothetical protein
MAAHDVAVVGGGPAGCSAAVLTGRYGLDTVVFDRGRSSLARCAVLENYLGFPGVDVETFYDLAHAHAESAGATVVADLVERVERIDDGDGFRVVPQEGEPRTADRVVAATRYDGSYLRPLGDDAMFETVERDGEAHETFDRSYPEDDGRTLVEGCYVASPTAAADRQAILAAGRGARVALSLIEDVREAEGYPEPLSDHYDWMRRRGELDDEWADPERWRKWFGEQLPDDRSLSDGDLADQCEGEIERRIGTYLDDQEIEYRVETGQCRLLEAFDDEAVLARAREINDERDGTLTAASEGGD